MPKININQVNLEIKSKQERVNELKSLRGTLDELELTDQ